MIFQKIKKKLVLYNFLEILYNIGKFADFISL